MTEAPYSDVGDDPINGIDLNGPWPGQSLWHDAFDVVATGVYGVYYVSYENGKAVNEVGCALGTIGCVASHLAVAVTPLPGLEAWGLGGDAVLDWVKDKTTGNREAVFDEDIEGGLLPRFIAGGGPKVFLPSFQKPLHRSYSCGL